MTRTPTAFNPIAQGCPMQSGYPGYGAKRDRSAPLGQFAFARNAELERLLVLSCRVILLNYHSMNLASFKNAEQLGLD